MKQEKLSRRRFLFSAATLAGGTLLCGLSPALASPGMTCAASRGMPAFLDPRGWSGDAWNAALPTFKKIQEHPFISGLADGTLPEDVFAYYVRQDALYLENYARVLATIAARLPKQEQRVLMEGFIKDTIAAERYMHELYQSMDAKHLPSAPAKASPTCQKYMEYEARMAAEAPVEVACAVILPCFTVYQQVGEHLLTTRRKAGNPYNDWIDAYADPAFDKATRAAVALCDELAAAAPTSIWKQMTEAYVQSTRMEWAFWDSAWKKESTPA
ncbi:MAG: TenA family protein [Mailhella sp.]|nr:TenA family protein [Mailhella sp.]